MTIDTDNLSLSPDLRSQRPALKIGDTVVDIVVSAMADRRPVLESNVEVGTVTNFHPWRGVEVAWLAPNGDRRVAHSPSYTLVPYLRCTTSNDKPGNIFLRVKDCNKLVLLQKMSFYLGNYREQRDFKELDELFDLWFPGDKTPDEDDWSRWEEALGVLGWTLEQWDQHLSDELDLLLSSRVAL